MKFRGLLVAVALLAVLGGLLWWSNRHQESAGKSAADSAPKILSVPEDQVREVRLKRTAGESTVVRRRDDGKWEIVEPQPLRADQDGVASLVSAVASLNADKLVEEKAADLAPYGLNTPGLAVSVIRKDGKTDQILIGDEAPTGYANYARRDGDPRVFTIASYTKSSLDKTANDLRDRRLLTFDSDRLTRLAVQAKGQQVEFGKNAQNDWAILKPRPLRADGSQVEEIIRKLKDARMDTTITDEDARKAASGFSSGARVAVATVSDPSGEQRLELRKAGDGTYYARSSVVEGVYKVGSDLGEGLDKKLDDFRNRKLYDFGWNDPTRVEVRTPSATAAYVKSGEQWTSGSTRMDAASVQALIDKLRDLSAAKFAETGGIGSIAFEGTVTSNGGKRVEKVTITKTGETFQAKREGEPGIYELDAKAMQDLLQAAGQIKPHQEQQKKK